MNIGGAKMRHVNTPLYGFIGESMQANDVVQLPVMFGEELHSLMYTVDFMVIDNDLPIMK